MRAETISEQLFFTTVRMESIAGSRTSVGTGFVYAVETQKGTVHFLVTNKHVVEGATAIRIRMVRAQDGQPQLGQATEMTIEGVTPELVIGHPDPAVDVAVLPFGPVIGAMEQRGAPPFFRSLSPALCASPELLAEVDAIEQVTFVGYPNGLYDTVNFLPIARRGSTATPLVVDYQGKPTFLIDASVFPGSSGSPVFLLDRGIYSDRRGGSVVGSRFACLGVVSAVHVRRLTGEITELTTALGVHLDEPIDLGIVYKARTIDETTDVLLARVGAVRVDAPISAPDGAAAPLDEQIAGDLPTE